MGIEEVADIIGKIADGFEEACMKCLEDNSDVIIVAITEQMYSGRDGNGDNLEPTYDDDPFFDEPGYWHNRAKDYKAWKNLITPPQIGNMLGLSPRPENVPNLYIDGTFYSEIRATRQGDLLLVDPGMGNGPEIVNKYGQAILEIGDTAADYFNQEYLLPALEIFFKDCGYV